MAKTNGHRNGKDNMVERHLDPDEIQRFAKKAYDLNEKIRALPKQKKAWTEERDAALETAGRGYELVEGEELPFHKETRA